MPFPTIPSVSRPAEISTFTPEEKELLYEKAYERIRNELKAEKNRVAKMATIACLLKHGMPYYFWVGFYDVDAEKGRELVVGPYQGTLGCIRIRFNEGVCGACAREQQTIIVDDVEKFPGHISCDSRSRSEMVVPVHGEGDRLIAVFDVDSELLSAFDEVDKEWLERILREQFH
jgi:GAF domain-containing protein